MKKHEPSETLKNPIGVSEEYLAWCIKNQNYKEESGLKHGNQILPRKS